MIEARLWLYPFLLRQPCSPTQIHAMLTLKYLESSPSGTQLAQVLKSCNPTSNPKLRKEPWHRSFLEAFRRDVATISQDAKSPLAIIVAEKLMQIANAGKSNNTKKERQKQMDRAWKIGDEQVSAAIRTVQATVNPIPLENAMKLHNGADDQLRLAWGTGILSESCLKSSAKRRVEEKNLLSQCHIEKAEEMVLNGEGESEQFTITKSEAVQLLDNAADYLLNHIPPKSRGQIAQEIMNLAQRLDIISQDPEMSVSMFLNIRYGLELPPSRVDISPDDELAKLFFANAVQEKQVADEALEQIKYKKTFSERRELIRAVIHHCRMCAHSLSRAQKFGFQSFEKLEGIRQGLVYTSRDLDIIEAEEGLPDGHHISSITSLLPPSCLSDTRYILSSRQTMAVYAMTVAESMKDDHPGQAADIARQWLPYLTKSLETTKDKRRMLRLWIEFGKLEAKDAKHKLRTLARMQHNDWEEILGNLQALHNRLEGASRLFGLAHEQAKLWKLELSSTDPRLELNVRYLRKQLHEVLSKWEEWLDTDPDGLAKKLKSLVAKDNL